MKFKAFSVAIFLSVSLWFFSGCNLTKQLGDNQALLNRNIVKGGNKELRAEVRYIIKHKPNRRILGAFKFHLMLYRIGSPGRNRFSAFLQKIGEPPVLLDSNLVAASASQSKQYLFNVGYFNARVATSINVRRKKAAVTYQIDPDTAFYIREIVYNIPDTALARVVARTKEGSFLKEGKQFDYENITIERNRIADTVRNHGYYYFTKQFIYFIVDSNLPSKQVKITVGINNFSDSLFHKRYRINKVFVEIEYPIDENEHLDTVLYDGLYFILHGYKINKKVLTERVFLRSGRRFRQDNLQVTYSRLVDLQLFKFINIKFDPVETDTQSYLTASIVLTPHLKHEFIEEPQFITSDQTQVTTDARNYGIANMIQYRNRNLFRSADLFDLRWRASIEAQLAQNSKPVSNTQSTLSASLLIPRLLLVNSLVSGKSISAKRKIINYGTSINASLYYNTNYNFTQRIISSGLTYHLNLQKWRFYLTPFEINYSKTNLKPIFISTLSPEETELVYKIFATNITTPFRFSFTYTNRGFSKSRSFIFLKYNVVETAGNSLSAYHKRKGYMIDASDTLGNYKFFGEKYFQYAKTEIDFTFNTIFDENNSTVFRINTGIALPYQNSSILPFEKRFFIGGANGLRAWKPRVIGPGSFDDSNSTAQLDRSGEMKLELNAEYRFDITNTLLEGAVFIDAGNIWNVLDKSRPGGMISNIPGMISEMALDAGVGLRLNFDFIIVRIDPAIPIRDPRMPIDERLVISNINTEPKWLQRNIRINIGIGYPF